MSETHPNAFLLEAQEKRAAGNRLIAEADALEARVAPAEEPVAAKKAAPKKAAKKAAKK